MNFLLVGTNKTQILEHLPDTFLLIDDGPLIDAIKTPPRRKVTRFDVTKHTFNPLKDIDYRRARDFIYVLDAIFPEGQNTLTRKNSNFVLLKALRANPKSLPTLVPPKWNDPAHTDALQKIETLLLSPVLSTVLTGPQNFPLRGIVLARLNRAELGDFDCFVLANLLVSNYKGHVVVPDFGFYGAKHHLSLMRQNRLVAGVNFLAESPLRNSLLLIEQKTASHCLPEDAETLAQYEGLTHGTNAYNDFIERSIE